MFHSNILRLQKPLRFAFKVNRCLFSKLYEPDYLETMKPKIPIYDTIDIQIKGYDFRILESYQSFIHTMADNMNISVEESWATPAQKFHISKFKPKSNIIDAEYDLNIYERNVQIVDIPSTTYSVFLRALETALPVGVQMTAREHKPEYEEIRYVPDQELKELKTQLDDMGGPKKTK